MGTIPFLPPKIVQVHLGADFYEHVPSPWTAVSVKAGENEAEVGVWGRSYRFAGGPLPAGITTAREEILDGPMRLVWLE